MPQIELDQDVLDYIRSQVRDFGETPSSVLRRLLGISGQAPVPAHSNPVSTSVPEIKIRPMTEPDRVERPTRIRSRHAGTAIQRYMSILSEIYQEDPTRFGKVESVKGRKRIYFHKSSLVIEGSGNSVNPEKIPNTPYYAATNLSDDKKKRILSDVLNVLGIHGEQRIEYLSCMDPEHVDFGFTPQVVDLDDCI